MGEKARIESEIFYSPLKSDTTKLFREHCSELIVEYYDNRVR